MGPLTASCCWAPPQGEGRPAPGRTPPGGPAARLPLPCWPHWARAWAPAGGCSAARRAGTAAAAPPPPPVAPPALHRAAGAQGRSAGLPASPSGSPRSRPGTAGGAAAAAAGGPGAAHTTRRKAPLTAATQQESARSRRCRRRCPQATAVPRAASVKNLPSLSTGIPTLSCVTSALEQIPHCLHQRLAALPFTYQEAARLKTNFDIPCAQFSKQIHFNDE